MRSPKLFKCLKNDVRSPRVTRGAAGLCRVGLSRGQQRSSNPNEFLLLLRW